MIPKQNYYEDLEDESDFDFEIEEESSLTYALRHEKIVGRYDDLEAVKKAVLKILNTERYEHEIYSWDYGVELQDLIGKDIEYVIKELDIRIKDALMEDERIQDVTDFQFELPKRHIVRVTFTVISTSGEFESEVDVHV